MKIHESNKTCVAIGDLKPGACFRRFGGTPLGLFMVITLPTTVQPVQPTARATYSYAVRVENGETWSFDKETMVHPIDVTAHINP